MVKDGPQQMERFFALSTGLEHIKALGPAH